MLHCPGFEDVVGEKGAKAQREEGFAGDYPKQKNQAQAYT